MRIAYLARVLPCLSETFVVREIAALRRLGMEITPFSIHSPDAVINPEIPDLAAEVEVLVRPLKPLFWLAHLALALAFPAPLLGLPVPLCPTGSGAPGKVLAPLSILRSRPLHCLAFDLLGDRPRACAFCQRRRHNGHDGGPIGRHLFQFHVPLLL